MRQEDRNLMFKLSKRQTIKIKHTSLATVTPSLTILGEPYLLSRTTFRPLGPRVTPTRSASLFTPVCNKGTNLVSKRQIKSYKHAATRGKY
jgi:hypothetical protein